MVVVEERRRPRPVASLAPTVLSLMGLPLVGEADIRPRTMAHLRECHRHKVRSLDCARRVKARKRRCSSESRMALPSRTPVG